MSQAQPDPTHFADIRHTLFILGTASLLLITLWILPAPPGVAGVANYLPLHTALETIAIVFAALVFAVGWNSPTDRIPVNVQVLACTFVGVALLDFTHMLSYAGMPDFITPSGPEKAINFWLAARFLAALGLLFAVCLPWRPQPGFARWTALGAVLAFTALMHWLFLMRPEAMPRTFIPGEGLTPLKIAAEYVLVAMYATAAAILLWRMRAPCPFHAPALISAAGMMALSELFFTLYSDVTDIYNLTGHVFKAIAYYLLYRAIFVETVRQPYQQLRHSQAALSATTVRLADERRRFAAIIAGTNAGTWEWNVQTGQTIFNERWAEIIGYTLDELQPVSIETWQRFAHPEDLERSVQALQRHFSGETPFYICEARMRHHNGDWIWVHDRGEVRTWTPDGQPEWMFGTHIDITARRAAEAELLENQENLRLAAGVFAASLEGILITDAEHRIIDVNPAFETLTGFSRDEVIGQKPRFFGSGRHDDAFYGAMQQQLLERGRWKGELWNRRKSGEAYVAQVSISATADEHGRIEHYVAIYADISSLIAQQEQLHRLANYDALTGLPNRRLLEDRLQQALSAAQRNGTRVAIGMLDLDGFKPVNDTLGHEAGDRLLIEVARRIEQIMRADETAARLGGDEFVLLFLNGHHVAAMERILQALTQPFELGKDESVTISASAGLSHYRKGVGDGVQLIREADEALYRAKRAGKAQWVEYASDHATSKEKTTGKE